MTAVSLRTREPRKLGRGRAPVWGHHGLAVLRDDKLMLRRQLDEPPETLLRGIPYPIDWSAKGDRLLAYRESTPRRAVLIDLGLRR